MWLYRGKEFTSKSIDDNIGFVYLITHLPTGKKYVGKKQFYTKTKRPPLKGKTRKRTVIKESNWQDYYGSSIDLNEMVVSEGPSAFVREILHLCKTKGVMSYMELREQVERGVLLSPDYWNGIIQCKIHRSHLSSISTEKSLDIEDTT